MREREQFQLYDPGRAVSLAEQDEHALARAFKRVELSVAPNTRRAAKRAVKAWRQWCEARGYSLLPVLPQRLVLFLESNADKSKSWIEQTLWGVAELDARTRATPTDPDPVRVTTHPLVRDWMRAIRRQKPMRQKPAPAFGLGDLRRMVETMYSAPALNTEGRRLAQLRDRALCLVGFYGALRRDELRSLRVGDLLVGAEGLVVVLRRSKTDQEGEGAECTIRPQSETLLCAVDAWTLWRMVLEARGLDGVDAPAFPALVGARICDRPVGAIYELVRRRAAQAGLVLSPHSFRCSFATLAVERGHEESEVRAHGRWAPSSKAFDRYVRRARSWRRNPTAGLT